MLATQQIFLIASLLCLLTFLTQVSVSFDGVRGMRAMLVASVLGMVGNALYAFGRELPPLLAYEAANIVYAGAGLALAAGFRQLAGKQVASAPLAALLVLFGVLVSWFHYGLDSFLGRSAVVSLWQIGVCAAIARTVLRSRRWLEHKRYASGFILAMCTLVTLGHAGRMAWLAFATETPTSLLQPSMWSIFFLTAVSLALPALAMGGFLIAHRQLIHRAEHAANHDFLTGAFSRKAFFDIADREMARMKRTGRPLALLLIDLDHFKAINDSVGHQAGDAALQLVADSARRALRSMDCLARLGGDEFALLLPETSLHGAAAVGDKLRQTVRTAGGTVPPLTLSIGVTVFGRTEELPQAMARADQALYDAKAAGRNRVVSRPPDMHLAARSQ